MSPNVPERSRSERPPGSWTRSPLSPHSGSPHFGVSWTFYRAAEPQAVTQQARVWRVTIKLQLNGWKKKSKTNPGTERGTSLMRRKENNKHRERERESGGWRAGRRKEEEVQGSGRRRGYKVELFTMQRFLAERQLLGSCLHNWKNAKCPRPSVQMLGCSPELPEHSLVD